MLSCLLTLLIWRSKHTMHWMLCLLRLLILLSKHIHTFLPITFIIFNQFLIWKKFWKAETRGFSTISSNTICRHCQYKLWHSIQNIIHSMLCMLTLLIQLKRPDSELSKTSNGLKISWISRKLWAKMCWRCWHCRYSWKALILSFPKLFWDWKSVEY